VELLTVDLKIGLRNAKIFSVDLAPNGFSAVGSGFQNVVNEVVFVNDNIVVPALTQICDVKSLSLVDFNRGNYVFISCPVQTT